MDPKLTARGMSLKLRVELGKLPMQRLALASYVGDPDACAALTALAAEGCGEAPPDRPESFDLWLPGLKAYGQGVVLRTSLAFSRLALLQWREIRRELKEKSAGHLCYPLEYDLVIAADACLAYRLPDRLADLTKTLSQAEDATYDLHQSDNLPRHAQMMALFVHTARIVLPLCWSEAFDAAIFMSFGRREDAAKHRTDAPDSVGAVRAGRGRPHPRTHAVAARQRRRP